MAKNKTKQKANTTNTTNKAKLAADNGAAKTDADSTMDTNSEYAKYYKKLSYEDRLIPMAKKKRFRRKHPEIEDLKPKPFFLPPENNRRTKPKDFKKVITGMGKYIKEQWKGYVASLLLVIIANALALFGPKLSGQAIDAIGLVGDTVNFSAVWTDVLILLLIHLLSAIINVVFARVLIRTVQKTIVKMRQDTFNKIVELPLAYIDTHQAGDIVSRISYDLDLVSSALSEEIIRILASFITVFGSLIMMFVISWELALFFLLTLPLTVLFIGHRRKVTRPLFSKRSRELGRMNAFVEEVLTGQKTIASYGEEDFFVEQFDEVNDSSMNAYYEADYEGSLNGPSVTFISNFSQAMVALFGGLLALQGKFTVGQLSSFVFYSRNFSGPVNQIALMYADLQSAASAAERVFVLLDEDSEPEDKETAVELTDIKGKVEFRNVSFSYVPGVPVLKNLSFVANPGALTAIVGPTGSGKTTIVNLLMRFYDPQEGEIFVDDINIKDIKRKSLRRSFAMVLQDTWLFNGTIRENIAYGEPDIPLEKVEAAAKAANMDEFIESEPNAYDTIISDSASNLSQGQKQLLTIARAMLLDAPMLILDEATSNVDSKTEIYIQDAMNNLVEGRTSFVIAHRLSTIQNADNILVINNGEIAEQGTHKELLNREHGIYKALYESQFADSDGGAEAEEQG